MKKKKTWLVFLVFSQHGQAPMKTHHLEYAEGGILDMDDLLTDLVEDRDKVGYFISFISRVYFHFLSGRRAGGPTGATECPINKGLVKSRADCWYCHCLSRPRHTEYRKLMIVKNKYRVFPSVHVPTNPGNVLTVLTFAVWNVKRL